MERRAPRRASKFLGLVLRHRPEAAGIALDTGGWVDVTALLEGCRKAGISVSREQLGAIVAGNDKQRLALSSDGARIRASQGHSVSVELELAPREPPELLYHGTVERYLAATLDLARTVGARRGRPIVLDGERIFRWRPPNPREEADSVAIRS